MDQRKLQYLNLKNYQRKQRTIDSGIAFYQHFFSLMVLSYLAYPYVFELAPNNDVFALIITFLVCSGGLWICLLITKYVYVFKDKYCRDSDHETESQD